MSKRMPNQERHKCTVKTLAPYGTDNRLFAADVSAKFKVT